VPCITRKIGPGTTSPLRSANWVRLDGQVLAPSISIAISKKPKYAHAVDGCVPGFVKSKSPQTEEGRAVPACCALRACLESYFFEPRSVALLVSHMMDMALPPILRLRYNLMDRSTRRCFTVICAFGMLYPWLVKDTLSRYPSGYQLPGSFTQLTFSTGHPQIDIDYIRTQTFPTISTDCSMESLDLGPQKFCIPDRDASGFP